MIFLKLSVLFVLFAAKDILAQQCKLDATHMDKRWIYMLQNDILHTDSIPNRGTLNLICTEKTDRIQLHCNAGTLQAIPQQADCTNRKRALVDLTNVVCSANQMSGVMYNVHYNWLDGTTSFLYEVCYSHPHETVLYARHRTYGFDLSASSYKRPQFSQSGVVSKDRADSFQTTQIYTIFQKLLGPKQTYVESSADFAVQRGHLANSQDFVSYDQMDETFKYVNVVPQFRGVNNGNWKRLENWIHQLPAKGTFATVVTGTYGILKLPHSKTRRLVPIYLMTKKRNPMPQWSYKVVKYNKLCYAFVTLNDITKKKGTTTTRICRKTGCPKGLVFKKSRQSGLSYCCNYNHFVNNVGNHAKLC